MTNRREFLQAAAAATAAPAAAGAARASDGFFTRTIEPAVVVIDGRFAAARAFGERMSAAGAPVRVIDRDVTELWRSELRELWTRERAPIAGLTARQALFVLERLSWEHRLRVTFHAEHAPQDDGRVSHAVLAGGAGLRADDLERADAAWGDVLAQALAGHPLPARAAGPSVAALAPDADERGELLASWIIAPVPASTPQTA